MKLTTTKHQGDWKVRETVELVRICKTGPHDEPWHIMVGELDGQAEWVGQEPTKRDALETVAAMIETGVLKRKARS